MRSRTTVVAVMACALLGAASAASAQVADPGQSVVGQGKLPGAPELIVETSGGNDVIAVAEGLSPAAYGAPNTPGGSVLNGCIGTGGFVDAGDPAQGFSSTSRKHQYVFSFPSGVTATSFSLTLHDWGDFLPFGAAPDGVLGASLTAFNANGDQIAVATQNITTGASAAVSHRPSVEYGDLFTSGDACTAAPGQPGRAGFSVTSEEGMAGLTFGFADQASTDSNIALSSVAYTLTSVLPRTKSECKANGWRSFHDGPARFKNEGDCVSFVATGGKNGPSGR